MRIYGASRPLDVISAKDIKDSDFFSSGVAIQVALGAYAPLVSKIHNILVCDFSELCMYEDLLVQPTRMFVK